ncbi:PGG domain [Sesbania bispinosa]|nr:PGG domain [Sesbania bispinosa]
MEILADPNLQDDTMRELYDASLKGCVSTLKSLIQRDPLILSRVSLYPFTETPLHIASLLGHLEFCEVLLHINPTLAVEVDSEGRCPLHLASAKGHTEIVKALLQINPEMCLIRDKDDKLPLHFAVMRGRMGAIKELIRARPDCIREMTETDNGSILHLCVHYNHLEALKLVVESVRGDYQFFSTKDKEDNTVLHLAVKRRQIKIIKYLISLSEMSTAINTLNRAGLTAMDMLDRYARDSISISIEHILTREGAQRSANLIIAKQPVSSPDLVSRQQMALSPSNNNPPQSPQSSPSSNFQQTAQSSPSNVPPQPSPSIANEQQECSKWDRFENFCRRYLINQGNWIDNKKTEEQWMVAATVIATMTFSSVISPPGGVWQADTLEGTRACTNYGICAAGTAVVATFMLLTYMWALGLVSPDHIYYRIRNLGYLLVGTWSFLLITVGLIQATRVIFWIRSRSKSSTNARVSHNQNPPGRLSS